MLPRVYEKDIMGKIEISSVGRYDNLQLHSLGGGATKGTYNIVTIQDVGLLIRPYNSGLWNYLEQGNFGRNLINITSCVERWDNSGSIL